MRGTLILTGKDVAALLSLEACIAAVEQAFLLYGEGKAPAPAALGVHANQGGFHVKAGLLSTGRSYFAAKLNANFMGNQRFGLPTIQGVIVLCDAENGYPLAVMDSIEITIRRTGAATAVAARRLARPESSVATICGCGNQGRVQLQALKQVLPIRRAYAYDSDESRAREFAMVASSELKIEVTPVRELKAAAAESDVWATCTPSKRWMVGREHVRAGAFLAAVGADNEEKQEIEPELLAASKVVADVVEQCATFGDLHHAITAGLMTREDVYADLGQIVAGKKPGRTSPDEIVIFDSTGMALEDVAAAALTFEKATSAGRGRYVQLGG